MLSFSVDLLHENVIRVTCHKKYVSNALEHRCHVCVSRSLVIDERNDKVAEIRHFRIYGKIYLTLHKTQNAQGVEIVLETFII